MLTRWNDAFFGGFEKAFMNDLVRIDEYLKQFLSPRSYMEQATWNLHKEPNFHLSDEGDHFLLLADLPGIKEEDLEITANSENLVIKGAIKAEIPEGYELHYRERPSFEFVRSFNVPAKVDVEKVEASLSNGVLSIKLPKAPELQPKQIDIKAG